MTFAVGKFCFGQTAVGILIMSIGGATRLIFERIPRPEIWQWVVLGIAFLADGVVMVLVSYL